MTFGSAAGDGWGATEECLKGMGEVELACVTKVVGHFPIQSAEARALEAYERLRRSGD